MYGFPWHARRGLGELSEFEPPNFLTVRRRDRLGNACAAWILKP